MGNIEPFDFKRANLTPVARFDYVDRYLPDQIKFNQLAPKYFGGKGRGIDPASKSGATNTAGRRGDLHGHG